MNNELYTYSKNAIALVAKLADNCTTDTMCENYGQKEIRTFIDRMEDRSTLTYAEKCAVRDILYKVNELTP